MRLTRLTLKNFRGFAELDLTLPETTTVLVGINGAGKTSILDAIALSLETVVAFDKKSQLSEPLKFSEIRDGETSLLIGIEATVTSGASSPHTVAWTVQVSNIGMRPTSSQPSLRPEMFRHTALAYYPVDRVVRPELSSAPPKVTHDAGLLGVYATAVDYSSFFEWYEAREDLENETIREHSAHRDAELEAVRRAIQVLLPGFSKLRVRRARVRKGQTPEPSRLVVTKGDITLELSQLSHGERGLLAMSGDIARRLAMAGPDSVEPHLREGIVLIDEIDLHLHPQWQREVLPRLEQAFPNTQFIVTTHSPQVISQLKPESVKLFNNFSLVPTPPTYGRDTNAILSEIMGLDEFPRFSDQWRRTIAQLIDEGHWAAARAELQRMTSHFGELDREVLRFRTMIDMLDDSREAAK
jgi:predicted ATP-binding protein involved in virulence